MSGYRQIHTSIWKDGWFLDLPPDQKLLFIYLFSNERASIAGIYELPLKVICFETDLDKKRVVAILKDFIKKGKVLYDFERGLVWVVNLRKYNENPSPKVQTRIRRDLELIPDCELKQNYIEYHNLSIPYPKPQIPYLEKESEQEQDHEQEHELEQDQDQEQEHEHEIAAIAANTPSPSKKSSNSLPIQAQVFLENGGKFRSGKLKGGQTKKAAAVEFMVEKISDAPDDLADNLLFWGRVVEGYCRQWSSYSYMTMVNEYYLKGRLPGESSGGDGSATRSTYRTADEYPEGDEVLL